MATPNLNANVSWLSEASEFMKILRSSSATRHIPLHVIYNGVTTVAIFPDGKKVKARPNTGEKFDPETGLAMCIAKHVFGSRAAFLRAVEGANYQNKVVK